MRVISVLTIAFLAITSAANATISFTQIDDDLFVISHRVKIIGSRGKATKMVYTKAASLCQAAGYAYFRVLRQESEAHQRDDAANASLRVRFYFDDGEDHIDCDSGADPTYVNEARTKLAKKGYVAPARPEPAETAADSASVAGGSSSTDSCTLEQIAAMARAGLSDEKIRAACSDDP